MTKLLKKIKSLLPQGLENTNAPQDKYAVFTIHYKDLEIGEFLLGKPNL